ncbi:MAG: leucine-rich repeat protein, partial [Muribaculaceae bacterium]|nr:leucine-rich repeat protein [Muribaculaceae bacterium]
MKKFLLIIGLAILSSALAWTQETFSYGDLTFKTISSSDAVYVTGVSAQGASSTTIYIPSAVPYNGTNHRVWGISDNAFQNNTTVKSVVFNWGARIIGVSSFAGCTNLTEVHLSSSVARIDASAFAGCTSLQKVYYSSFDFPSLSCQASSWPSNSGMTLYISPLSEKTPDEWLAATGWNKFSSAVKSGDACDYHLEDGGQYAVGSSDTDGVDVLRNLTLVGYKKPSRVSGSDPTEGGTVYRPMSNIVDGGISFHFTRIGTGALYNMTALKKIDLSYAIFLKTINERAFMYCSALTTLKLPASV